MTIQAAIYRAIIENNYPADAVHFYPSSSITSIDDGKTVTISTKSNNSSSNAPPQQLHLRSRLLVGADGAMSAVRKLAGISTWGWEYGQEAIVATVCTGNDNVHLEVNDGEVNEYDMPVDEAQGKTAWQKYLSAGNPLALLPLWGGYSSIVWWVHSSLLLSIYTSIHPSTPLSHHPSIPPSHHLYIPPFHHLSHQGRLASQRPLV